jgi:hypothetical protein
MVGTLIVLMIFVLVFSMSVGVVLGKLFWTPPIGE